MIARVFLDFSGSWSGGGKAVMDNLEYARDSHDVFRGNQTDLPLIPRNFPPRHLMDKKHGYLLMPQNVWPWMPVIGSAREASHVARLRAASEVFARRAFGVIRISESVPARRSWRAVSPVFHNVLDRGFDRSLADSREVTNLHGNDGFVSIGSFHSYRNYATLLEAYAQYRRAGGKLPLLLAGRSTPGRVTRRIEQRAATVDGVHIITSGVSRADAIRLLATSRAAILPSRAEASPLAALEAAAICEQVILSDIPGHRGVIDSHGGRYDVTWFPPSDATRLSSVLQLADEGHLERPRLGLDNPRRREAIREDWAQRLATWTQGAIQ